MNTGAAQQTQTEEDPLAPYRRLYAASSPWQPRTKRTWGEALGDAGLQLAAGAVNIAGAIPNLAAPDSRMARGARDAAQALQGMQSAPMQRQMEQASEEITLADPHSPWQQGWAALRANLSSPALASRLVATNLPSMVPVLGAAKAAQGATLAARMAAGPLPQAGRRAAQAAASRNALAAAAGTNAVLNAGGARGEAFEDLQQTAMDAGLPEEQARNMARARSRAPAALGAATGAASGLAGLEASLFGNAAGKVAGKAASPFRGALRQAGIEAAGEMGEELLPQAATNLIASQWDGRSAARDLGRTAAETLLASAPFSGAAAYSHWGNARRQQQAQEQERQQSQSLAQQWAAQQGVQMPEAAPPPEAPRLGFGPTQFVTFPDGTTGTRAQFDTWLQALPENERSSAMARVLGYAPQDADAPAPAVPAPLVAQQPQRAQPTPNAIESEAARQSRQALAASSVPERQQQQQLQQAPQVLPARADLPAAWQEMDAPLREALLKNAGAREDFAPHLAAMPWQRLPQALRQRLQAGSEVAPAPANTGGAVTRPDATQTAQVPQPAAQIGYASDEAAQAANPGTTPNTPQNPINSAENNPKTPQNPSNIAQDATDNTTPDTTDASNPSAVQGRSAAPAQNNGQPLALVDSPEQQAQQSPAIESAAEASALRVGTTPRTAEAVTVKDGTVHVGNYVPSYLHKSIQKDINLPKRICC